MNSRLVALLTMMVAALPAQVALAQDARPPLSAAEWAACSIGYSSLREVDTRRRWLNDHGTGRLPAETCRLAGEHSEAELKTIQYLEANGIGCGMAPDSVSRLREAHKTTEAYRDWTCRDAKRWPDGHPVVSDFGDPALRPRKKGP